MKPAPDLDEAILRSARLRALLLAAVLCGLSIPLLLFQTHAPFLMAGADPDFVRRFDKIALPVLAGIAALIAAEGIIWRYLGKLLRAGRRPGKMLPFAQTALEVLLPTGLLFGALHAMGPMDAFGGAIPWVFFPMILLSSLHLDFALSAFAGLLAAAGFIAAGELALAQAGAAVDVFSIRYPYYIKGAILAGTGMLAGLIALGLKRQLLAAIKNAAERDRAVSIFGQHVSPQVASRLLHQPIADAGESRHVCVLFLDIRDFSVFAAAHSAPDVMGYLNTLFGPLIDCVNAHAGVVNKFLGDGFMAVFGAPTEDVNPSLSAARCAFSLLEATDRLVARGSIPPTRLGIGLHAGESVTGNVGAEARKEYTVIGDTVNLAARIEQATKTCSAQLLVSEDVWNGLPAGEFRGEDLGPVELKGQPRPVRLYRLR